MSSPALCAIAHWGGRSSIPETLVLEPRSRGVLDAPPARSMTVEWGGHERPQHPSLRHGSLGLHRVYRAKSDRQPVPGIDGPDQHGQIDRLRFREVGAYV